ncbi:nucleotidyltransferase [Methanococcoides sp. SA1]|nr:nucleotidyltransferase [Methanococcoides sp. SA1]
MGGSGGGFDYPSSNGYKAELEKIREESYDGTFETSANELIADKLGEANSRDAEKTRDYLDQMKEIIEGDIEGTVDLQFGGSVSKFTYVEGLSDVDVLLKINKSELSDKSPKEVLEYIKSRLESKITNVNEIKVGKLAVTVKYNDGTEIQILPSIKKGEGFKIPSRNGKNWSNIIRPDRFASRLTEVNQQLGGKVVPVIKMAKHINSKLPPEQQLSGYHIESLAIEIFKNNPDIPSRSNKTMLKYFYEKASEKVKSPINDSTNQSLHVDDYLYGKNSPQRVRMSYILSNTYKSMKAADDMKSVDSWNEILGDD